MIFGKPNKNLKFVFSGINLINTDQYTYLDIKFQPNGSFTKCIDYLRQIELFMYRNKLYPQQEM